MTDEQIDRIVQTAIPELRIALKAVTTAIPVHAFDIAQTCWSGKSKLVCFIANEMFAAAIEGMCGGISAMHEIARRQLLAVGPGLMENCDPKAVAQQLRDGNSKADRKH